MSTGFIPDFEYADKTLNKEAQEKYVLSIQFALDGFSFLFLDAERKKFTGLEGYSLKNVESDIRFCKVLDVFLQQNTWIKGPFKDVFVLYESAKSTLVPEPLFDETEKNLFLKFNHTASSYEQVASNHLKNTGAYQVFTLPDCLRFRIDKTFKRKSILHHSVPLIESLSIQHKNQRTDNTIFIHFRKQYIDIVIFNNEGLLYYNAFYTPGEQDVLYYLLFVMEQLRFNPEETELVLLGNIRKQSSQYELLRTYVRNISFDMRTQAFGYSYVFDKIPDHEYYTLFNSHIIQI